MRIQPHRQFFEFSYSIQSLYWIIHRAMSLSVLCVLFPKIFPTVGNFDNFRSNSRKLIVDYLIIAGFELLPTSKFEIEKSVWHWMNHPRILVSEIYSPNILRNRFTVLWLRNRSLMSVVLSQLKLLIRSHFQFWFCSHLSQHGKSELLTLYSR